MEVSMIEFLSSTRNRMILGGAALVVLAGAIGGGYYFSHTEKAADGKTASIADAGVCNMVVDRARDYGVIPFDAAKAEGKTVDTANPNRVTCNASAQDTKFTLTADVPCDNAKDDACLVLQKVTNSDGASLYNAQNI
jgi:hypothetical protein